MEKEWHAKGDEKKRKRKSSTHTFVEGMNELF